MAEAKYEPRLKKVYGEKIRAQLQEQGQQLRGRQEHLGWS